MGVRGFYGGSKPPPYTMMGTALDRYLPGRNAMLANEVYVRYGIKGTRTIGKSVNIAINHLLPLDS